MKSIYLDYAAASPMDRKVLEAMQPYFIDKFYNPSATYLAAQSVRDDLNEARSKVAACLGARSGEIVFTAGATEANNLATAGLMQQHGGEILISSIEHESVLEPAHRFDYQEIAVDQKGVIDLVKLQKQISDQTTLISVMYVNNELGTIQPLSEISQMIQKVRHERLSTGNKKPIFLHTDAAQAGNYLDLHVARLGVDLMSINGGKIYGPKQSGVLYVKAGVTMRPQIVGGGQEFGLRSGTENVASAVGLATALGIAQKNKDTETKRIIELKDSFISQLTEKLPQAVINGLAKKQAPHILNVTFPGIDNERLMMQLDEAGVICAVGSACSASSGKASHVLSAIGLSEAEARSSLRFSLGKHSTTEDIDKTVRLLQRLVSDTIA